MASLFVVLLWNFQVKLGLGFSLLLIFCLETLMAYKRVKELMEREWGAVIRVRVCRCWRHKRRSTDPKPSSFEAILVDTHGDAIQASMLGQYASYFEAVLKVGHVYIIKNFYVEKNKFSFMVVPHSCKLKFSRKTISITEDQELIPRIPIHKFYLLEFGELLSRKDNDTLLTDVLGHVQKVFSLENIRCEGYRYEHKREVWIQNLRCQTVKIVLWGDAAVAIDTQSISELNSAAIMVFTSMKIRKFGDDTEAVSTPSTLMFINPPIEEVAIYLSMFVSPQAKADVSGEIPNAIPHVRDVLAADRTTIIQLQQLDVDRNRNVRFTCEAKVIDIDLTDGWYYNACPICNKSMKYKNGTECYIHGLPNGPPPTMYKVELIVEDDTEEAKFLLMGKMAENFLKTSASTLVYEQGCSKTILPPRIANMLDKTFVFQVQYGDPKYNNAKSDLRIKSIVDKATLSIHGNTSSSISQASQLVIEGSENLTLSPTAANLSSDNGGIISELSHLQGSLTTPLTVSAPAVDVSTSNVYQKRPLNFPLDANIQTSHR